MNIKYIHQNLFFQLISYFFHIFIIKFLIFFNFSKNHFFTSELIFGPPNLTSELILTSEPHFGAHVEISVGNHPIVPILSGIFSSMSNYIDSPENHASEMIIFLRGTRTLAWPERGPSVVRAGRTVRGSDLGPYILEGRYPRIRIREIIISEA